MKKWFVYVILMIVSAIAHAQLLSETSEEFKAIEHVVLYNLNKRKATINLALKPLTAIVFLSPECPLCRNYTLVLNEVQQKFEANLQLIGIVPGTAYEKKAVSTYAKDYKLRFPLLTDPGKKIVSYTKATITPEVILLNSEGHVIYRGAIDNWVEELGKKKRQADNHYLADAIQQYFTGAPVAIKHTQPKGCYINEF